MRCSYKVKNTVTMNKWVGNPLRRYAMGAWYLLSGRGPMGFQTLIGSEALWKLNSNC